MQKKLEKIKERYQEIEAQLHDASLVMHHQKLKVMSSPAG